MAKHDNAFQKEDDADDRAAAQRGVDQCISPVDGKPSIYAWAIQSRELRGLGLTHAEFAVFCAVIGFAGWNKAHRCAGVCIAGTRRIATEARCHPDYVRELVKHLVRVGLVTRVINPGKQSELRPVDKFAWLAANPHGIADRATFIFEETKEEVQVILLWRRLFALLPGARKIRYERRMKTSMKVFLSVIEEMEDAKRQDENAHRTGKRPVKDWVGMFEFFWRRKIEANRK